MFNLHYIYICWSHEKKLRYREADYSRNRGIKGNASLNRLCFFLIIHDVMRPWSRFGASITHAAGIHTHFYVEQQMCNGISWRCVQSNQLSYSILTLSALDFGLKSLLEPSFWENALKMDALLRGAKYDRQVNFAKIDFVLWRTTNSIINSTTLHGIVASNRPKKNYCRAVSANRMMRHYKC